MWAHCVSKEYPQMTTFPALRSSCKVMSCGIITSPCGNTQPQSRDSTAAMEGDWDCAAVCSTLIRLNSRISQEAEEWFSSSHQRQSMLYMSCVRKGMTAIWRESESQWIIVAFSMILVVMETAEMIKSVKWCHELKVTKWMHHCSSDQIYSKGLTLV